MNQKTTKLDELNAELKGFGIEYEGLQVDFEQR